MCGLAGVIAIDDHEYGKHRADVHKMLSAIRHRGPDEAAVRRLDRCILGVVRLSIVDAAGGAQPVSTRCETGGRQRGVLVGLNGEIYNHNELRESLRQPHRFVGRSDTEVVAHLFEEQGRDAFPLLNGMFAVCLSDGVRTYLVRDRFGEKPLYYRLDGRSIRFASEVKALVTPGEVAVYLKDHYTDFETQVGAETVVRGVTSLPPGHYLEIDHRTGAGVLHRYFALSGRPASQITLRDAAEKLRWLLGDAVRIRTDTELGYACSVSGGIDSAAVAYLSCPDLLVSASVTGRDYFDERKYLDVVAADVPAPLLEVRPEPTDLPRYFVDMVSALDYPAATLAAFTQYLISQAVAGKGYRILLSGLGADEYLAGYARHARILLGPGVAAGRQFRDYAPLFAKLTEPQDGDTAASYHRLICRGPGSAAGQDIVRRLFHAQRSVVNGLAAVDMGVSLPPLLRADDRLNMRFGLEGRAPFMDHRLVEFAFSLPDALRIRTDRRGRGGPRVVTKAVLREALRGVIPDAIVKRPDKVGFPSPVALWLDGCFRPAVDRAWRVLSRHAPLVAESVSAPNGPAGGEFSRSRWLVLQWAAWHLLFAAGWPQSRVTNYLFAGEKRIRPGGLMRPAGPPRPARDGCAISPVL